MYYLRKMLQQVCLQIFNRDSFAVLFQWDSNFVLGVSHSLYDYLAFAYLGCVFVVLIYRYYFSLRFLIIILLKDHHREKSN